MNMSFHICVQTHKSKAYEYVGVEQSLAEKRLEHPR